ncbi:MAG: hypothetical protein ACO1NX_09420 [Chitinophagaceae bacterium]
MNALDFSIAAPAADNKQLLHQAINEINALGAHLGSGDEVAVQNKPAALLSKIMDDAVLLPNLPVMHKITDDQFLQSQYNLPIDVQQTLEKNNFYWLQIPVGVFTKENWAYSRIEVGVVMDALDGEDIPRAFRILPDKEFQQLFEWTTEGEIGLDANFNFSGKTAQYNFEYKGNELKLQAGAGANADFKSKMVYGPLSFKIRKTLIDYAGKNTSMIKWVLDDTQTIQDGFDLVGIIQVPKSYKQLNVAAEVRARRTLSDIPDLLGFFQSLSQTVKNFFKTGCPTRDTKQWNLSSFL